MQSWSFIRIPIGIYDKVQYTYKIKLISMKSYASYSRYKLAIFINQCPFSENHIHIFFLNMHKR